jgi:hypothetical protein
MTQQRKWLLAAILVLVEVVLAVLAWRDLDQRTDDQVRGQKRLWRAFVAVHPGNSVAYWLLGRR